jgi:hypothetical protein
MITETVDETKAQNIRQATDGLGAAQVPVDRLEGPMPGARLGIGASVWT